MAHDIIVVAKIITAAHIAHIIGASTPKSTTMGAINAPKVQNSPNTNIISAELISTASRKIYFERLLSALAYPSLCTTSAISSGVDSVASSGRSARHLGQTFVSPLTKVLQLRHSHLSFSISLIALLIFSTLRMVYIATSAVARADVVVVAVV